MPHIFEFSLPITNPVMIFAVELLIILIVPRLFAKIKIPGLVGLIIAGIIVGPNGLNIIQRDSSIILFGAIGLLYIMFLAALELDLVDFKKNRNKSIIFGALTFSIPMTLGTIINLYILELTILPAILLASIYASHTLLVYPTLSRLGVVKNKAVNITVGGTIITDTAALLVLVVIASSLTGELDSFFWIRLLVSLTIFAFLIIWGFPKIVRWYFKNSKSEGNQHYVFILSLVFIGGALAQLAGIEAITGAFLAGLTLNLLIPPSSALMNRIKFVGNALFIPFFLLGVGMIADYNTIFSGTETLLYGGVIVISAFLTKWLAAFATQKIYGFSSIERNIIFSLSNAHAAVALAVVTVGYNLGFFNEYVLNGTFLLIIITCIATSFIGERAGRKLAIAEGETEKVISDVPQRILVPISNPDTIKSLIEFAVFLKEPASREPIIALSIVRDDAEAREKIIQNKLMLEKAVKFASASENEVRVTTRIDMNASLGIQRAAREKLITDIIIGWSGRLRSVNRIFGSALDSLLKMCEQTVYVCKLINPLNTTKKIVIAIPENAELEAGFSSVSDKLFALSKQIGAPLHICCSEKMYLFFANMKKKKKAVAETSFKKFEDWEDFLVLAREVGDDDLFIVISAREGSVSYNASLEAVPRRVSKYFKNMNVVIIFPQQLGVSVEINGFEHNTTVKLDSDEETALQGSS